MLCLTSSIGYGRLDGRLGDGHASSHPQEAPGPQDATSHRSLSAGMACEGAVKAIDSWDLREKAIRKAAALARRKR